MSYTLNQSTSLPFYPGLPLSRQKKTGMDVSIITTESGCAKATYLDLISTKDAQIDSIYKGSQSCSSTVQSSTYPSFPPFFLIYPCLCYPTEVPCPERALSTSKADETSTSKKDQYRQAKDKKREKEKNVFLPTKQTTLHLQLPQPRPSMQPG